MRENDDQSHQNRGPSPTRFFVGELVVITDGPFEGFEAKIESLDHLTRQATVFAQIFGKDVPTEVPFSQLRKAP